MNKIIDNNDIGNDCFTNLPEEELDNFRSWFDKRDFGNLSISNPLQSAISTSIITNNVNNDKVLFDSMLEFSNDMLSTSDNGDDNNNDINIDINSYDKSSISTIDNAMKYVYSLPSNRERNRLDVRTMDKGSVQETIDLANGLIKISMKEKENCENNIKQNLEIKIKNELSKSIEKELKDKYLTKITSLESTIQTQSQVQINEKKRLLHNINNNNNNNNSNNNNNNNSNKKKSPFTSAKDSFIEEGGQFNSNSTR
jgi:hypothetical protein